jgi:hypothetical protein
VPHHRAVGGNVSNRQYYEREFTHRGPRPSPT